MRREGKKILSVKYINILIYHSKIYVYIFLFSLINMEHVTEKCKYYSFIAVFLRLLSFSFITNMNECNINIFFLLMSNMM